MKMPDLSFFNKPWVLLTMAVILGGVATFSTVYYLKTREKQLEAEIQARAGASTQVVVPAYDLPKGSRISYDNMMMRDIRSDLVSSLNLTADNFSSYVGQELGYGVEAGVPLLRPMLRFAGLKDFSDTIPESLRALTIRMDEINSISGMLRPGDRIDIFAKITNEKSQELVFPLLLNTPVKATGQMVEHEEGKAIGGGGAETTFSTATLEVTPRDAQRLILAQAKGKITAVLRNSEDYLDVNLGPMSSENLLLASVKTPAGAIEPLQMPTMQFILGGSGQNGIPKVVKVPYVDNALPFAFPQNMGASMGQGAEAGGAMGQGGAPAMAPTSGMNLTQPAGTAVQ
ncbi:MAG: Flp pilus assembly protein CpaB [Nitrospinota bacterium]|nr:Flp pilus assembly protein CpaB [Nitrospinota bacterium]